MRKLLLSLMPLLLLFSAVNSQPRNKAGLPVLPEKLQQEKLVDRFYEIKESRHFWFQDSENACLLRGKLKEILDSAAYNGLQKENYHYNWLVAHLNGDIILQDTSMQFSADRVYTDAAISYFKDLYQGSGISKLLAYDEITFKYESLDNAFILGCLSAVTSPLELEWLLYFLEPPSKDYQLIKQELRRKIIANDMTAIKQLNLSINMLRWVKHFGFNEYIVVNPASAYLKYFSDDSVQLMMKVVVGKQSSPTPIFAAYCNSVILYPYWHVPASIATKEILPAVRKDPKYLENRHIQVIDSRGKVIDHRKVKWTGLSAKNFPYQFRQSTGCDNAMGVLKFNLTDPFTVSMHDTYNKTAFLAGSRHFSHGCIRVESPVELANALLPGKIDNDYLEACQNNVAPKAFLLDYPVPVFIVYMPADHYYDDLVKYYKDVYKLVK